MFDIDELKKDCRNIEVELLEFKKSVLSMFREIILLVIHWLSMKMQ